VSRFSHAIELEKNQNRTREEKTLTNGVMSIGEIIAKGGRR
jgi:hypothetical protein